MIEKPIRSMYSVRKMTPRERARCGGVGAGVVLAEAWDTADKKWKRDL